MTDKKDRKSDDIDNFFDKFDELNNDFKNGSGKQVSEGVDKEVNNIRRENPKGVPSDVSPSAYNGSSVIANRSERYSKSENTNSGPDRSERLARRRAAKKSGSGNVKSRQRKGNQMKRKKVQPKKVDKAAKKQKRKKIFRAVAIFALIFIIGCGAAVALILRDTENINYDNIYSYLAESSVLYDDNKKVIDSIYMGDGNRVTVEYEKMPEDLLNAFIAIEDKTFWEHHGFNFIRLAGAVKEALVGDSRISGTSTLTQQLARNIWLAETRSDRSIVRKIKEAYYAIQLERHLSKEQIIEAYLNTIALGNHSLGVQAASQSYFSKDVDELDLIECAALASLPKSPSKYALVQTVSKSEVSKSDKRIVGESDTSYYLYNDAANDRIALVLKNMYEQGKIDQDRYTKALKQLKKLKKRVKPSIKDVDDGSQFFVDYTIENVSKDLMEQYDIDEQKATQMVYNGGLKIYTTLNKKMQKIVNKEFEKNYNFPGVTGLRYDSNSNLLNENGNIMLYKYSHYFNDSGNFNLKKNEFKKLDNGDLLIKKNKRLVFYDTEVNGSPDISIEFQDIYYQRNGVFYTIDGGALNIPAKYKSKDKKGNVIVAAQFMKDYPHFMDIKKKEITIPDSSYTLRQEVQQPQSSMVIMEHKNGRIKAMTGGRNIEGKMNYNRATKPRQPGSSIKPIATYAPAIESGANRQKVTGGESSYGDYWTAASVIKDEETKYNGEVWPKNWYSGYRGSMTLREAVEQSVNTIAVKVQRNIGNKKSVDMLKKLGVTTVVKKGATNDMNPAALALGGMTKGISPLEMASSYGTFANRGISVEPTTYTKIKDRKNEIVIKSKPEKTKAMDKGTAFIMNDILRTTVSEGIANKASISNQPVAGKTGTTTDNCDAWFVGNTPKYSAALWIGNDVKIQLSQGSASAASLWSTIMQQVTEGSKRESFAEQPSNVTKKTISGHSDYFIDGTAPGSVDLDTESAEICIDSGMLATPWCEYTETEYYDDGDAPGYYCNLHNQNPNKYPISPDSSLRDDDKKKKEEDEDAPVVEGDDPNNPTPTPEEPLTPTPSTRGIGLSAATSKHFNNNSGVSFKTHNYLNNSLSANLNRFVLNYRLRYD